MGEEAHSLFSASGADAWSKCPGKPAMEKGRKTTTEFADEGTACHTLASDVLQARIDGDAMASARQHMGRKIKVVHDTPKGRVERTFTVDQEMAEAADDYVDRFFLLVPGAGDMRLSERRFHYHRFLGVARDLAFGTSDGTGVRFDQPREITDDGRVIPAGDELVVDDLKYGKGVRVFADTMQLRLYAAGALEEFSVAADIKRVRLVIHQPRLDHWDEHIIAVDELLADVATLKPSVPLVLDAWNIAGGMRAAGCSDLEVGERLHAENYLGVSDKGCRFCDAKAVCPAMIADVAEGVSGKKAKPSDFEDLTVDGPPQVAEYGGNYLAAAYEKLERIEQWAKAVRAEIDRRVLMKGEAFPGLKVVGGRKGARAWTDKGEAEALAASMPKVIQDLIYKRELKTPTQIMDTALKTSPAFAVQFAMLIHQPEGKPAVVPLSDTRKAISHRAVKDDFEDLTQQPADDGVSAGRERHPFR